MNTEPNDQTMVDRLQSGFNGATYGRSATSLAPNTPLAYVGGIGVAVAVAATATVLAVGGPGTPALAWSPTPSAVSTDDEAAAAAACNEGLAETAAASDRPALGAVDAPAAPNTPTVLPPLVSLDARGTGALATFADSQWTFTCMLLRNGDGFERGPLVGQPTSETASTGELLIESGGSTTWSDGQSIAALTGTAPPAATTVEFDVTGLPTATAAVTDGRFSIWWLGSLDGDVSVTVRALDNTGALLGTTSFGTRAGTAARR